MPITADKEQIETQLLRVELLASEGPVVILPVMEALQVAIKQVALEGAPEQPKERCITIRTGPTWVVRRFAAHGLPWVSVQWFDETPVWLAGWLKGESYEISLATRRPDVPSNQIWVCLGSNK